VLSADVDAVGVRDIIDAEPVSVRDADKTEQKQDPLRRVL
jgi:hypothetical protein